MTRYMKSLAVVTCLAIYSLPSIGLEVGSCAPIGEISDKLRQEGQNAFAKGRPLSTSKEQEAMHVTRPASFGLIYFSTDDGALGYIAKTDVPLEAGPTLMCIDYAMANIMLADARKGGSYQAFAKSPVLAEYLKVSAAPPLNMNVIFQASGARLSAGGSQLDGTVITAVGNFANDESRGRGTIFFTNLSTGGTSNVYGTAGLEYTQVGLQRLSRVPRN